jgi:hypothetical protein
MAYTLPEVRRLREKLPEWTRESILAGRAEAQSWQSIATALGMSIRGVKLVAGVEIQKSRAQPKLKPKES